MVDFNIWLVTIAMGQVLCINTNIYTHLAENILSLTLTRYRSAREWVKDFPTKIRGAHPFLYIVYFFLFFNISIYFKKIIIYYLVLNEHVPLYSKIFLKLFLIFGKY